MKNLLAILIAFTFIFPIYGQTTDTVYTNLTTELESIYTQGFINGFSVAIVNQHSTLYNKGFGFADVRTNKEYTENTIQNIASISKTFIGVALLKAQELGKLNLDDPINKYLPFQVINPYYPNEPITIRHLTTHTSSIKDPAQYEKRGYILKEKDNKEAKAKNNFRSPDDIMPHETFLKNILNKEGEWYKKSNFLNRMPGQTFEYSNIGAGLAAFILEKATGESFGKFTYDHILKPLGMSSSGWAFEDVDFEKHSKLYLDNETELAFYKLINYPDGGMITSTSDLGKYLSELIAGYGGNGTILKKESYQELFKPQLSDKNYKERSENTYNDEYNMGVFMGFSAKGQIGHTGGDPGVATFMFFNTQTNIGKLLFVNTELKKEGVNEFIEIWKILENYENKL